MQSATILDQILLGVAVIGTPLVIVALWRRDVIRPGSFDRVDRRELGHVPGLMWFVAALLVFVAPGVLLGTVGVGGGEGDDSVRRQGLLALAFSGAGLGVGAFVLLLMRSLAPDAAGLRARGRDVWPGVAALLVAFPGLLLVSQVAALSAWLIRGEPVDPIAHDTLERILTERGDPWIWAIIAGAVIGAPITEEIAFRGMLQSAFLKWTSSRWVAIALTSLLFALVHFPAVPVHALPVLFVFGIALGVTFERSRGIGAPIVMHALFNALQIGLVLFGFEGEGL